MTIRRIWHGWTRPENAAQYHEILLGEVIPGIEAMKIPGYRGIEVLRRDLDDEVEFATIMTFDSIDSIVAFRGEDYRSSHVPAAARKVLARWDETAAHYRLLKSRGHER